MTTVTLAIPATWPFDSPVVPARAMPSGTAYSADSNGQIAAKPQDVGTLLGYGFTVPAADVSYMVSE